MIARLVMLGALVVAIVVVEIGLRAPAPPGVQLPVPGVLAPGLAELRATVTTGIDDARAGAVASGVVFGRTEHVTPEDETAFLESGLWHLLAASGQNIALVAACSIVFMRLLGAGRVAGTVVALGAIPIYVLIVGGGASIVRAGIMGELVLIAWLVGRLSDARQLLIVAAAAICWFAPGAHRSLGMQLSFACVAALMWWAVPLTRAMTDRGVPTWLAGGVAATVLCSASTAPLLVLRTGAAPLTGIVSNVLAVPLAGCILVAGLIASLLMVLGDMVGVAWPGAMSMQVVGWLSSALLDLAHRGAALPGAQTTSKLLAVGVPCALGVWVAARQRLPRLARGSVAAAFICSVVPLAASVSSSVGLRVGGPSTLAAGDLRIAALDVGQGDATLLQSGEHTVLVDTGPPAGRVVQRLRELGVTRVDGIVLTHDSLDHRGGFAEAHAALAPAWVARPSHAPGTWSRVERTARTLIDLCDGASFPVGAALVRVRNPPCDGRVQQRTTDVHNDGAMVLLIEHGDVRALLPADAEAPVLVRLNLPPLAFLRVAHHGSSDPDLPELLASTRPSIAAISVGEGNMYGHPTPQALAALSSAGVLTRRTDRHGTVIVDSDRSTVRTVG